MAYRQRYPKQTFKPNGGVQHLQPTGRGPGNIAGLDEGSRRTGVKGVVRPGSWTYPKQPFDRAAELAAKQGVGRAA
jgi:hypothetical protein